MEKFTKGVDDRQLTAMSNKIFFTIVTSLVAFVLFVQPVNAQAPEDPWNIFVGYKSLYLTKHVFLHDTHPDDWFLPDAEVPGSAGTTELRGTPLFFSLGFGYHPRLSETFSASFDFGFLLGGGLSDKHLNVNEVRPDDGYYHPSSIYSKVSNLGGFITVDLRYHIKWFYIGAEAQMAGIWSEYGWYRYYYQYSRDEKKNFYHYGEQVKKRNFHPIPSPGLKIGRIGKDVYMEGSVQFGRTMSFGLQVGSYLDLNR